MFCYLFFLNLLFLTIQGAINNPIQSHTIAWPQETLLKDMISFFDSFKAQEIITPKDVWLYKNVLFQASAVKDKQSIPEHILYKAEIARTIYMIIKHCSISHDIFTSYLKNYLNDWNKLSPIYNCPSHKYCKVKNFSGYEGISVYYTTISDSTKGSFWRTNIKEMIKTRNRCCEFKGYGFSHRWGYGYINFNNNLLNFADSRDPERSFLQCPPEGLLFCTELFFGRIDYTKKEAVLYSLLRQKIDFSNLVPWSKIEGGAYIFFNPALKRLLLKFHQDDYRTDQYHFKPMGQVVYQLTDFLDDYTVPEVSEIPCAFKKLLFDKKILL